MAAIISVCYTHIRIGREKTRSVVELNYSEKGISQLMRALLDFYKDKAKRCSGWSIDKRGRSLTVYILPLCTSNVIIGGNVT